MDHKMKQYIQSLKPADIPDWKALLQEGLELGKATPTGKSRFIEESKYESYDEYKKECAREGKIVWQILLGLATLDEQLSAIRQIYEFSQRTGLEIYTVQAVPSQLIALPQEMREDAAASTSYALQKPEDWKAHGDVAPMQIIFEDQHLSSPNSLETTLNALQVGSPRIGIFSQFSWGYQGFHDNVKRYSDMIKSIGIIAAKYDEYISIDTYLDDGIPGYFLDCSSYVAYALLEHYLCTTLCGARLTVSYGGLLSEGHTRMAVGMAIDKLLSTADQPAISYINGSTVLQWDHDIDANYGTSVQEMLLETLVERQYKMGMAINPVSITENVTVPTLQELLNIFAAGKRVEEKAAEWDELMDFTKLEAIRDAMCEQAEDMFKNILSGLEESGIDTKNALEMLLVLKQFNPMKIEMVFHPSVQHGGEFKAYYPTVLGRQTLDLKEAMTHELVSRGYVGKLDGKKIVVGSGDGHTYGLILVEGILINMGAQVINGGVDMEPVHMLNLADEEDCDTVMVSLHNGQALDYGKQIKKLADTRNKTYTLILGGKLYSILPGESEPTDVTGILEELGVIASNDIAAVIDIICD
jgi:hypothetical protein